MPKIIENARDQLLAEAKRQIIENGYAATTVRSVAGALGIGVGTVYNYFESKEMLIATFVFEDWKRYLAYMSGLPTDDSYKLLNGIYGALQSFAKENEALFSDPDASRTVSAGISARHKILREQISEFVLPVCYEAFDAEFVSEALICWSMDGKKFDTVYPLIKKLIKNNI